MKISILLFLCFCFALHVEGQNITGRLLDEKRQPISFGNIKLEKPDSTFVTGTTSGENGRFQLSVSTKGDYLLTASYIGYVTSIVRLDNLAKKVDLGDIILQESTMTLGEVAVSASRVVSKIDRQVVLPSPSQVKMSASGYDLLSKMMLPGLRIDPIQNSVSTIGGGNVQLRINDMKASTAQVLALRPAEVVRVEYIDEPGVRYGEDGIEAVVNFIVKRVDSGVSGGVNLSNAVTTGFGDDMVYVKANHKRSEFGLNYSLSYRDLEQRKVDDTERFLLLDGQTRERVMKGVSVPFNYATHNVEASYNFTEVDKYTFNVIFRDNIYNSPNRDLSQIITETGRPNIRTYTREKDKNSSPALDIYYQMKLPRKQNIAVNVVGTYIGTDFLRDYNEYKPDAEEPEYRSAYTTNGNKYSLIGEAIYDKTFKPFKMSAGMQHSQAYTKNSYTGATDATTEMHTSNTYLYMQLQGRLDKLSYVAGVGVSRQYFDEGDGSFTFYTFRPSLMLSYPIFKGASLRYNFSITPNLPSLSDLSDVRQQRDNFQVRVGNPNLVPFRSYNNTLRFQYANKLFSAQLTGSYSYQSNPIMQEVKRVKSQEGTLFEFWMENQKSFATAKGQGFLRFQIIPEVLSVSGFGGVGHFVSRGNQYSHKYTSWYGGGQMEATVKNWSLGGAIWSRTNSFYGESISYGEYGSQLNTRYKFKNLLIGAGVLLPFSPNGLKVGRTRLSDVAFSESWTSSSNFGNLVTLTVSWNFNYGRKHESTQKKLENSDTDSGIVK